jgi:hypothetical protein
MPRSSEVTLLDVIRAVGAVAVNHEETIATVVHLISRGQVRLGRQGQHGHEGRVGNGGRGDSRP